MVFHSFIAFNLQVFEKNLEKEGLELEYEQAEPNGLRFIKIHAPREVLRSDNTCCN